MWCTSLLPLSSPSLSPPSLLPLSSLPLLPPSSFPLSSLSPPSLSPPSLSPPSLSLPSCSWLFACATAQKIASVDYHLMKEETTPQNSQTGHTESGGHPSGHTESGGHPSGHTESGGVSLEKPSEQIKLPFKPNFDVKVETRGMCCM